MKKRLLAVLVACTVSVASFAACTGSGASLKAVSEVSAEKVADEVSETVGALLLSINPEIEISYDSKGIVVELEGINEDGKNVVNKNGELIGLPCEEAIKQLVGQIYELGFFDKTIAEREKNIIIKVNGKSVMPSDEFLNSISEGVEKKVSELGMESKPIPVDETSVDDKGYIKLDKAKEIVLTQLGMDEAEFVEKEYKLDDGVYELEFVNDGIEYEYELDAVTGKVLEADIETNDDWDRVTKANPEAVTPETTQNPRDTKVPDSTSQNVKETSDNTGQGTEKGSLGDTTNKPVQEETAAPDTTVTDTANKPVQDETIVPTVGHRHHDDDDDYDDDRYDYDDHDDDYDDDRYDYDDHDDDYDDDRYDYDDHDDDDDDRYDYDDHDDDDDDRYDDDDHDDDDDDDDHLDRHDDTHAR